MTCYPETDADRREHARLVKLLGREGTLDALTAERAGANETLNARQLQARAEIDAATLQDREAQKAIEQYAAIRDVARQNVEVLLEAYDLGRTTLAELLTEQRRYLEVETGYTDVLNLVGGIDAWATPDGVVQFRDDIYNRDGLGSIAATQRG